MCRMCHVLIIINIFSADLLKILNQFYRRSEVKKLAAEHGLDGELIISKLNM